MKCVIYFTTLLLFTSLCFAQEHQYRTTNIDRIDGLYAFCIPIGEIPTNTDYTATLQIELEDIVTSMTVFLSSDYENAIKFEQEKFDFKEIQLHTESEGAKFGFSLSLIEYGSFRGTIRVDKGVRSVTLVIGNQTGTRIVNGPFCTIDTHHHHNENTDQLENDSSQHTNVFVHHVMFVALLSSAGMVLVGLCVVVMLRRRRARLLQQYEVFSGEETPQHIEELHHFSSDDDDDDDAPDQQFIDTSSTFSPQGLTHDEQMAIALSQSESERQHNYFPGLTQPTEAPLNSVQEFEASAPTENYAVLTPPTMIDLNADHENFNEYK